MRSLFPGMDPYLEGYLWPDVHHRIATEISDRLMPVLQPRYVARIEIQVVQDETPGAEIGIMYPDVEIVKPSWRESTPASEYPVASANKATAVMTPVSLSIPRLRFEVRLARVAIRDVAQNELVTMIEILSPVNKREPGLSKYAKKRERLFASDVHLLEIDLLRRGQRLFVSRRLEKSHYLVSLTRAGAQYTDIWKIDLKDRLPVVPVPLRQPDSDVLLDLTAIFDSIYRKAAYHLSVDYGGTPPPPALTNAEQRWLQERLA
ncbi:MAG: DUF4058 family protein [Anaerolineales bacterium]